MIYELRVYKKRKERKERKKKYSRVVVLDEEVEHNLDAC